MPDSNNNSNDDDKIVTFKNHANMFCLKREENKICVLKVSECVYVCMYVCVRVCDWFSLYCWE